MGAAQIFDATNTLYADTLYVDTLYVDTVKFNDCNQLTVIPRELWLPRGGDLLLSANQLTTLRVTNGLLYARNKVPTELLANFTINLILSQ